MQFNRGDLVRVVNLDCTEPFENNPVPDWYSGPRTKFLNQTGEVTYTGDTYCTVSFAGTQAAMYNVNLELVFSI